MKRRIKESYRTAENPTTLSIDELTNAYKSVIGEYVKALIGKIFGGAFGSMHITGDNIIKDIKDLTNHFNDRYRQDLTANNIVPIVDFDLGIPQTLSPEAAAGARWAPIVDFDLGIPQTRRLKKYGKSCPEITSVDIIAIDAQDGKKTLFTIYICSDRLPTQDNLFKRQITGARLDKKLQLEQRIKRPPQGNIMKITLKALKNLIKEAVYENARKRYRGLKSREFELSPEEQLQKIRKKR